MGSSVVATQHVWHWLPESTPSVTQRLSLLVTEESPRTEEGGERLRKDDKVTENTCLSLLM